VSTFAPACVDLCYGVLFISLISQVYFIACMHLPGLSIQNSLSPL